MKSYFKLFFAVIELYFFLISADREAPAHTLSFAPTCDMTQRMLVPPPVHSEAAKLHRDEVKMELENSALWKQFSSQGTEMIITKKGR